MKPPIASLAARESPGGCSPGRYLPVSTPSASGDQHDLGDRLRAHRRDQLGLGRPPEHRVLGLGGDELHRSGDRQRGLDLLGVHSLKPR